MNIQSARKPIDKGAGKISQINPNAALSLSVENLIRQVGKFEAYNALVVAAANIKRDIDLQKHLQCSGVKR